MKKNTISLFQEKIEIDLSKITALDCTIIPLETLGAPIDLDFQDFFLQTAVYNIIAYSNDSLIGNRLLICQKIVEKRAANNPGSIVAADFIGPLFNCQLTLISYLRQSGMNIDTYSDLRGTKIEDINDSYVKSLLDVLNGWKNNRAQAEVSMVITPQSPGSMFFGPHETFLRNGGMLVGFDGSLELSRYIARYAGNA